MRQRGISFIFFVITCVLWKPLPRREQLYENEAGLDQSQKSQGSTVKRLEKMSYMYRLGHWSYLWDRKTYTDAVIQIVLCIFNPFLPFHLFYFIAIDINTTV